MKTIKFLSMMLVMLAMSVCMAGCSNDDDDSEFVGDSASIVGSWVQTNLSISRPTRLESSTTPTVTCLATVTKTSNTTTLKKTVPW